MKVLTDVDVEEIIMERPQDGQSDSTMYATGVKLTSGHVLKSKRIISGCTPYQTFLEMMPFNKDELKKVGEGGNTESIPSSSSTTTDSSSTTSSSTTSSNNLNLKEQDSDFHSFLNSLSDYSTQIRHHDNNCGAFKINCALSRLPEFLCTPDQKDGDFGPMHRGTVHFETKMEQLDHAFREGSMGIPASRPAVEMTIPSSLDETLVDIDRVNEWLEKLSGMKVDQGVPNFSDLGLKSDTCWLGPGGRRYLREGGDENNNSFTPLTSAYVAQLFVQYAPYLNQFF